jgi:hypothetical protein
MDGKAGAIGNSLTLRSSLFRKRNQHFSKNSVGIWSRLAALFIAPPPLRSGGASASGGVVMATIMCSWVSFYSAQSDVFQHF